MRAVQVAEPGGALRLVEREIPQVSPGQVRVRVQARGVCHSDMWAATGALPGTPHPIVLGHLNQSAEAPAFTPGRKPIPSGPGLAAPDGYS